MTEHNAAEDMDLQDPTDAELQGVERLADEAETEAEDDDAVLADDGDQDESEAGDVQPGADGPEGTGIEGADDALLAAEGQKGADAPDLADEFDTEDVAAAEQGNRVGDEMVSEGEDDAEVAQLDGDDRDVDALAEDGIEQVDVIDGMPEVIDNADDQG